jgi:hypothetical protein
MNYRDTERPPLSVRFRYIYSFGWLCPPGLEGHEFINEFSPRGRCFDSYLVYASRIFTFVDLRYSSDAQERVRVASQHEPLQRAHLLEVALL